MRAPGTFFGCPTVFVLIGIISGLAFAQQAAAARRRGGNAYNHSAVRARQQQAIVQAATAQLNAAKQVLAAAESKGGAAQSKLDSALVKLREEAERFHDAQSTTRHLAKELAEIENEILEEQKADSPYAKAGKQVEMARQKLTAVEERILQESKVLVQLSGLTGGKLAEKKTSLLGLQPDYLEAKVALEAEANVVARIRSELFQNDKDWKAAADALTQARKDEREAEEKTHGGTSGRIGNLSKAKSASEA
ncbi:MAG TPA: hypothetical protein VKH44_10920, partial [Pirellulaceae bacterium]|nr:hypothetical protein [Pirellulaceae bacterium]